MHPIATFRVMASPKTKFGLLAWAFLPGALLSLVSPILISAVPLILERETLGAPNVWSVGLQYRRPQRMVRRAPVQRPLGPIVGTAAIDGLWRSARGVRTGKTPGRRLTGDHRRIEMGRRQAVLVATSDSAALAAIAMAIVALVISPHFSLSLLLANRFQIFGLRSVC